MIVASVPVFVVVDVIIATASSIAIIDFAFFIPCGVTAIVILVGIIFVVFGFVFSLAVDAVALFRIDVVVFVIVIVVDP